MNVQKNILVSLGLEEYFNCILVQKDVRPAFMIQPPDYRERIYSDPITSKKLSFIQSQFPDLYQIITNWGIIISKNKIYIDDIKSDKDIGEILGYPCSKDFEYIDQNKDSIQTFSYNIIVKMKNSIQLKNISKSIQLFADLLFRYFLCFSL